MSEKDALVALVAVERPLRKMLHYLAFPDADGFFSRETTLAVGHRVIVPLGRQEAAGYVVELRGDLPTDGLRSILGLASPEPLFTEEITKFLVKVAEYYHHPYGEVFRLARPPGLTYKSALHLRPLEGAAEALARGELPPPLVALLSEILERSGTGRRFVPEEGFKKTFPRPYRSALGKLLGAGLVERSRRPLPPQLSEKKRLVARALPGADPRELPARFRVQREALELLLEKGPTELSLLEKEAPGAGQAARRLEKKGLVEIAERAVRRDPRSTLYSAGDPGGAAAPGGGVEHLTPDQETALAAVEAALQEGGYRGFLLKGVTGSGKTEVYLRAIETALASGGACLYLVPEIALTAQLVGRLSARVGDRLALAHSGLSQGERYDEWRRAGSGEALVVAGARSALFVPVKNLRLVIVDEEHEESYKQEDGLLYQARDMALLRAHMAGATAVLGSATPSLESLSNARAGKLTLLEMPVRVASRPLPKVEVVDAKEILYPSEGEEERKGEGETDERPEKSAPPRGPGGEMQRVVGSDLSAALRETYRSGRQSLLFLNRRGYSTFVVCLECGSSLRCPTCDIALTFHRGSSRVGCHYCGVEEPVPDLCPHCKGTRIEYLGFGTELLEEEVGRILPGARIARLDRDAARRRGEVEALLSRFGRRELDVLVGTQMVAKGHDFPGIALVGVILADQGLNIPDFRAGERVFSLLTQVAGRAGRGDEAGRVIVQSLDVGNAYVTLAAEQDYDSLADMELELRRALYFPPFANLLSVRVAGKEAEPAERFIRRLAASVRGKLKRRGLLGRPGDEKPAVELLGPTRMPLYRLRGLYRWQFLLKAPDRSTVSRLVREFVSPFESRLPAGVRWEIDVDPYSFL